MNGQRIGQKKMTREDYKAVKKMDRQQFERFCRSLYEQGQQSVTQRTINLEEVKAAILEIKGVGEKRADQIIEILKEKIDEKEESQ